MFFLSVRMSNSSGSWQGDVNSAEVGICSVVPSVQEGERGGEALNDAWRAIVNKHGARKTIRSSKTMEHYSVAQRELQVYVFLLFSS